MGSIVVHHHYKSSCRSLQPSYLPTYLISCPSYISYLLSFMSLFHAKLPLVCGSLWDRSCPIWGRFAGACSLAMREKLREGSLLQRTFLLPTCFPLQGLPPKMLPDPLGVFSNNDFCSGIELVHFNVLLLEHLMGMYIVIKKNGWHFKILLKFGSNFEIWSKFWNLVEILKFGWNFEIWSKFWNLVEILKFG